MFTVPRTQVVVPKHLGGSGPLPDSLSAEIFSWLDAAAIGAEKLIRNGTYPVLFQKFSQVDDMSHRHVVNYPAIVRSCMNKLEGIAVCVAPLSRQYAIYIRPGEEEVATANMRIYINARLLSQMQMVMNSISNAADNSASRAQLACEFTSLLACKIFHEANHLLLTLVDDADPTMNLIGITATGEACMSPKHHFGLTFCDFGSLMERVCFGGILLLECWEKMNLSQKVLVAKSETLNDLRVIPTIASVGLGVLGCVVPIETTEPAAHSSRRRSSGSGSGSGCGSTGQGRESDSNSESDTESDTEQGKRKVFFPVELWHTVKRVATARP